MKKQKSDTRRFFETMWIMAKYDVLPWMVGAGILALMIFGLQDAEAKGKFPQQKTVQSSVSQRQR